MKGPIIFVSYWPKPESRPELAWEAFQWMLWWGWLARNSWWPTPPPAVQVIRALSS